MATYEPWASSDAVRHSMQGNRSRDTKPELVVRRLVHRQGLRYRVNARPIDGLRRTADLVFRTAKVAVFIDGCFWHGCPEHYKAPRTNPNYWSVKVERNRRRDREVDSLLESQGWTTIRVWEHHDPQRVADLITDIVRGTAAR